MRNLNYYRTMGGARKRSVVVAYEGELFRDEDIRVVAPADRVAALPRLAALVGARPAR